MSNFVRIGTSRINLDTVAYVDEIEQLPLRVQLYFNTASECWQPSLPFHGDEAALLLALIDQDSDQVDALYARVNGTPEIVARFTTEQVEALGGTLAQQAGEAVAAVDADLYRRAHSSASDVTLS